MNSTTHTHKCRMGDTTESTIPEQRTRILAETLHQRSNSNVTNELFTGMSPSNAENGSMVKLSPEELVKAFRKVARELGYDKSEERFQEALFTIGQQKMSDAPKPKGASGMAQRPITSPTKGAP